MIYSRCKCGKSESWSSYGAAPKCVGCNECGTTLETSPERHTTPEPHHWIVQYDTNTGKPYGRCIKCMAKRDMNEEGVESDVDVTPATTATE